MTVQAPRALRSDAEAILAAVTPPLEALGADRVEVLAKGVKFRAAFFVGYRLREGVVRTASEMRDAASVAIPGSVDYHSLWIGRVQDMPVEDPELKVAQARIRGPWWKMWPLYLVLVLPIGFLLAQLTMGRGDLVASANLRAAGTAATQFTSSEDELGLWADLDGYFTGSTDSDTLNKILPVHYEVDLVQNGAVVHHLSIDTQVRRSVQKTYCTVAPDCEVFLQILPHLPPGPVQMRVTGTPARNVTRVSNMSLNVRVAGFF